MTLYLGTYDERNVATGVQVARMAALYGADAFVQIGAKWVPKFERTDVVHMAFESLNEALEQLDVPVVALEMGGESLGSLIHPPSGLYLVGPQNGYIPPYVLDMADHVVTIETPGGRALPTNVCAGIVLHDRLVKGALVR